MQHAKREASVGPNRVARWAWISLAASAALAAAWLSVRATTPDRADRGRAERESVAPVSAEELQRIKASIGRLERTSSALKVALAAPGRHAPELDEQAAPGAEAETEAATETTTANPEAEIEKHRAVLRDLDATLAKDAGDPLQRSASAAVFRDQLNAATQGRAQVVDMQCGSDFCKATLEEDTSVQPAMNTGDIIDATPFLREEAMFDYETDGTRKRTLVYAALEGRSLPFDRGAYPTP